MSRWRYGVLALVFWFVAGPALAGPNAGGTLVVHELGLNASCEINPDPASCSQIDVEASLTPGLCWFNAWKVFAAFPDDAAPRLKGVAMGADFGPAVVIAYAEVPDPGSDFVVMENGWPYASGGTVGISFGTTQTSQFVPCYLFAGYAYYVDRFAVVPHPAHPRGFFDDSEPPVEDYIAGFGWLGFGQPGYAPCPSPEAAPDAGDAPQVEQSWGKIKAGYR